MTPAPKSPDESSEAEAVDRAISINDPLTTRELEILRLLSTDLSRREMAEQLSVSRNTIKAHCRRIYRKLAVTSRHEAVLRARAQGLL